MTPSLDTMTLLELLQRPKVGPAMVRGIVRRARAHGLDVTTAAGDAFPLPCPSAADEAARIVARCAALGVAIVGLSDAAYPLRLAGIPDPPPVLYVRGSVDALREPSISVVGTREASKAGLRAAYAIGEFLARRGIAVVSGLALGIDTAAHLGALDKTIAVLAHGLHMVAPVTNLSIATRLLERSGALVSEHPPDVEPKPYEFVRRNRIQSGLSMASIVVESGEKGGAMHHAQFAVDQKRPLFVVLSSGQARTDLREDGARALVASAGARPITGTADLAAMLPGLLGEKGTP
jgi:DNA processing protein